MIKNYFKRLTVAVTAALLALCMPVCVFAESEQKLMDDASLFTTDERSELEQRLEELSEKTGWDVIIYTNYNGIDSDEMEWYYSDYYDDNGFGKGFDDDGVMFTIDMGTQRRQITTKGGALYYFSDSQLDEIKYGIVDEINGGDYYGAAEVFINGVSDCYDGGEGDSDSGDYSNVWINEKNDHPVLYVIKRYGWIIALASLIIAGLAVCFTVLRYKNNGKKNTYDLHANSNTVITNKQDDLIDKKLSVVHIHRDNGGGSSGGSSHSSSSSHGGGGSF